ncbi:uncharacterized protein Dwil_GK19421 [Drosophila willistoni]|uniref:thioredoxin-dependent peroxiredoxin n=1 Tax=Drosophila willistoni TaxID=7260 RepID=B4N7F2_DROWI|nr:uncharacterized protein Dwil_GK19421 [Drosophila willistoni]
MKMLNLRQLAPEFNSIAAVTGGFRPITLTEFRGRYVVLLLYPADFSFVCPTELHAFSDRAQEFRNVVCDIIACSTDSHYVHCAWMQQSRKQGGLVDIPLLADKSMKISKDYGVLDELTGLAMRGLFILDREGMIRQITINDVGVCLYLTFKTDKLLIIS